jgi:WD40 repeat protein
LHRLQFSQDGRTLVAGRGEKVWLWDLSFRQPNQHIGSTDWRWCQMTGAVLAADGKTLASTHIDGGLRLWDRKRWRVHMPCGVPLGPVSSLALSPSGELILVGHRAGNPNICTSQQIDLFGFKKELRNHGEPLSGGADGVRPWNLAALPAQPVLHDARLEAPSTLAPPDRVHASPDGRYLAAGSRDGSVWLWNLKTREFLQRRFITGTAEAYAKGVELLHHVVPGTPEYQEGISDLMFAPDSSCLAVVSTLGQISVWDTGTWQPRWQVALPSPLPSSPAGKAEKRWVCFAPNAQTLAVGAAGTVRILDCRTGKHLSSLGADGDAVQLCGAFAPNGHLFVTGTAARQLRRWDVTSGKELQALAGHLDQVTGIAFAPDGRTLASCGPDRTVRLWNVSAWQEVATLEGHRGRINTVAFSPDSRLLISGGETTEGVGEVLLWRAQTR